MNYEEAREYIRTLYEEKRIILGLERVSRLMSLVDNPQDQYPCAIITGTNGKGSTAIYLSSILNACGLKVGTNLSPHVQDITERFIVDLERIDYNRFAQITSVFKDVITNKWQPGIERPTFHELMTAMAFYHFNENNVDFAVMEVGMGGRYDACNIVDNKLSIFTPIHFDHCRYLGDSLQAIAQEKAQIMKSGGVAVSAPQPPQVKKILKDVSRKKNVHFQYLDLKRFTRLEGNLLEPVKFNYMFRSSEQDNINLELFGQYQIYNAALAILAAEKIAEADIIKDLSSKLTPQTIKKGLSQVVSKHLPARLELVGTNPALIIDGSHNAHAVKSFMNELRMLRRNGKITLVIGFKEGKNYFDVLPLIDSTVDKVIFTNFENRGGVPPSDLKKEFEKIHIDGSTLIEICDDPLKAVEMAIMSTENKQKDLVAIVGSLYLAGELKRKLPSQSVSVIH